MHKLHPSFFVFLHSHSHKTNMHENNMKRVPFLCFVNIMNTFFLVLGGSTTNAFSNEEEDENKIGNELE